jgi:hypothetical protein
LKRKLPPELLLNRINVFGVGAGDDRNGAFMLPASKAVGGRALNLIVSDGGLWDHVSVTVQGDRNAIPIWEEMAQVKRLCFRDDEAVMQLHVAASDHINAHPGCLHLWRPQGDEIPLPPAWMVA